MPSNFKLQPETSISQNRPIAGHSTIDSRIVILAAVSVFIHAYICGAVALLATVYALANPEKRKQILYIPHIRWLAFFAILTLIVPVVYGNWLGLAVGAAIIVILIFYLYLCTVMNEGLFNTVADLACIISLIYFLIALFQRILGLSPRSPSTFQNANYYSFAMELAMMLFFYRLTTAKTRSHKAFVLFVIAATVAALFMADSRSAWPTIFGGLFVYFILNRKMLNLLILIGVYIGGIRLALSFPAIFPRLDSFDIAGFIRTNIWLETLNYIKQYPLFGTGAMGFLHLSTVHKFYHSHNLLLELLVSFGVAGTVFLGAYFMLTFRNMYRVFKLDRKQVIYPLVFAAVTVTAIHGLVDVTVLWPQTGILLALMLAGGGVVQPVQPVLSENATK